MSTWSRIGPTPLVTGPTPEDASQPIRHERRHHGEDEDVEVGEAVGHCTNRQEAPKRRGEDVITTDGIIARPVDSSSIYWR